MRLFALNFNKPPVRATTNYATTFKDDFELDTRISVTNAIDLTGVTITEQMVSWRSWTSARSSSPNKIMNVHGVDPMDS